jgi:hypothetical protein
MKESAQPWKLEEKEPEKISSENVMWDVITLPLRRLRIYRDAGVWTTRAKCKKRRKY